MSDGALSQDEIDALLAGVDSSAGSSQAATATAPSSSSLAYDRGALEKFFSSTTAALSSNLSALTGAAVTLSGPQAASFTRDDFLGQLPDMVTVVGANYTSGFPGEHIFILPENSAKAIATLMTKEDNIQLDDMAMSVIGEVVSQMVGTQITSLTDKTGNKSIAAASPSAANVPKAVAALPAGEFAVLSYQLNLGDGVPQQMWEILGPSPAVDISHGLNGGGSAPAQPKASQPSMGNMGGMGMNGGMQMPGMQMPGMQMPGMQMPGMGMQMPGMGMPGMGMGGMGMGGMPNLGPTNVQPVQFPNLMQPRLNAQESGNIGLIMDVSMEMTVELGRTRKLIKEILGMGEGTIIELDKLAGEPVDILVNHKLIAKGEVVVIDENFGVRVTEIVSPMERLNDMG